MVRVSLSDLSRLPVERLARLLMDRASEDPMLLGRLHETIVAENAAPAVRPARSSQRETTIVGTSPAIRHVTEMIRRFVRTDEPVLITGESGTGKELAARAIHETSGRRDGPFVAVNCAAIPANLVASELFGYEKGAFTGANARTKGQIEHANGGTLFLDEIGDMPLSLQSKILRFLEQGEVQRIGGNDNLKVDVRVVAATNADLETRVKQNLFREDLFYRLAIFPIKLPPLRERLGDIEKLAESFMARFCPGVTLSQAAVAALMRHEWPGNVRELRNVIERASILAGSEREIMPRHILI